MKIDLYTSDGNKKGTVDLPAEMFEAEVNEGLMHDAIVRQQANSRIVTASTKTRSQVRGGGRKPWRQKGTGRARQGSIRSAHWRGGGIIFGPDTERNYQKQMPKKMRRKALFSALSARAQDKVIIALESFQVEIPKTKVFFDCLKKIKCEKRVLVVAPGRTETLEKSVRNIPHVKLIHAGYLNIIDILSADHIIFLSEAITKTTEIFCEKK